MAPETLVFMPNGDVTLTLIRNVFQDEESPSKIEPAPQKPLVNGDKRLDVVPELEAEVFLEQDDDEVYFAPDAPESEDSPFYPPTRRAARGSDASSLRDRSSSPPASFWAALKRQEARIGKPLEEEAPTKIEPKRERVLISSHEVHCVVSSGHLTLASPVFKAVLTGDFNEAITLKTKGRVSIPLSADLDAMIILLNIVHGASRKVPREVNIELLGKLAVLVHALGMSETVQFFSDTWLDNFQGLGIPKSYDQNVLPLLFIFWVFDRQDEFKQMTRLTQRECDEKLDDDVRDVPIPHSIIDAIKRDRQFAMETAITTIHSLITRYMDGKTICDGSIDDESRYACDAMVLGSLMKSSRKMGIWPKPETPFIGRKFKDLALSIRGIRILDVCQKSRSKRLTSLNPTSNCHGLESSIEASMKSIESGLDGLEVADYPKKRDNSAGFRLFLLSPKEELQVIEEEPQEDDKEDFQIYMEREVEEEVVEDAKTAFGVTQFHPSVPEPKSTNKPAPTEIEQAAKEERRLPNKAPSSKLPRLEASPKTATQEIAKPQKEQEPEVKSSPKVIPEEATQPVKMDRRESSRYSLSQESIAPAALIERPFDDPPAETLKTPPPSEAKPTGGKKMSRANSVSKRTKEEPKAPAPVKESPALPKENKEEIKPVTVMKESPKPKVTTIEVPTHSEKEDSMSPTEVKDSLTDTTATTEEGEMRGALPQNFKMRRSKKKFSATKF